MNRYPEHHSSQWLTNFEDGYITLLHSANRLLIKHSKARRKAGPSTAERSLLPLLLQLQALKALLDPDEQQRLLILEISLSERLERFKRRRIVPCPTLRRFRAQCRKLEKQFPSELANWDSPSVLVGSLRWPGQLDVCLEHGFYHFPAGLISEDRFPVDYIAIYQSRSLFEDDCGIYFYGQVKNYTLVRRRQICEIPKDSDELYYRLEVVRWEQLERPITVREIPFTLLFSNLFLLTHSRETPELSLATPKHYCCYHALQHSLELGNGTILHHPGGTVRLKNGLFQVFRHGRKIAAFCAEDFIKTPSAIFRQIMNVLEKNNQKGAVK